MVEWISSVFKTAIEEVVLTVVATANQKILELSEEVTSLRERVHRCDERLTSVMSCCSTSDETMSASLESRRFEERTLTPWC